MFDEVMPEIATGFVAYRRRELGIGEESEESLKEIYRASLSLLYKLLFVLYAEARSLLPVQNPAYWEESLTLMARQFAERIDRRQAISDATHATRQCDSLLALFRRIDQIVYRLYGLTDEEIAIVEDRRTGSADLAVDMAAASGGT
ncbi:MAG: hypothetical protein R2844_20155 [Caldilineales bacterium]